MSQRRIRKHDCFVGVRSGVATIVPGTYDHGKPEGVGGGGLRDAVEHERGTGSTVADV